MKVTIQIPDDLVERLTAAGITSEETSRFAVVSMHEVLDRRVATAGEGLGLSPEEEEKLHKSILEGIRAADEGRIRPAAESFADFEKRHGITTHRSGRPV